MISRSDALTFKQQETCQHAAMHAKGCWGTIPSRLTAVFYVLSLQTLLASESMDLPSP
jgi:hypothetical protein